MMNNQIEKDCIINLLKEMGKQEATGRVRSKSLLEEMSLVGFIPYTDYYINQYIRMTVNLNSDLHIAPYLVKFSEDTPVFPFFTHIEFAADKRYEIGHCLYIDTIVDKVEGGEKYKTPFNSEKIPKLFKYQAKNKELFLESREDRRTFYIGQKDDIELSDGLGNITYISNNFLCLCRYMNKVTGRPSYTVLTSTDTIRIFAEDGEV